jgi:predicted PurR-regulated permease PerM
MQTPTKPAGLERNLGWIALLLLLFGCLLVLRPFASALLWAVVLVVVAVAAVSAVAQVPSGRRTWAALLMALGMILIMLLPFFVVGVTLADNVKTHAAARAGLAPVGMEPPAWLTKLPAWASKLPSAGKLSRRTAPNFSR